MNRRKLAAAALTAALVAGGSTAAVLTGFPAAIAQSEESTAPARGSWIDEALAPLVEDGTLAQADADAVREALLEARPHRGHGRGPGGARLEAVAGAIGIEVDALREALMSGQTIAEVAEANGVPVGDVIDALVAALEARLAGHVENGDKTQEEADEILAGATERITALVNREPPLRGPGFGHGGHGPRGPHR